METKWKEKCDESVSQYLADKNRTQDDEAAIFYHADTLEGAIFIRGYMQETYPEIDIVVLIKGFIYNSQTMKQMSKEWFE